MQLKKLSVLLFTVLLAACSGSTDKYPYPPQFVQPAQISVYDVPAPPQPGSATYKKEIKQIMAMQAKLTKEDLAEIDDETHIRPAMLVEPVLGKEYNPENLPKLYALLDHVQSDAWRLGDKVQDHWNETRPWLADPRVKRYVEPITRPGYPSGHTITNTTWALVLGDMMPCQTHALLKRAYQIGYHRVDGGAHFPHDIEQGKKLARKIYHEMLKSPAFGEERNAAQEELNHFVKFGIPAQAGTLVDSGYVARCGEKPRPELPEAPAAAN